MHKNTIKRIIFILGDLEEASFALHKLNETTFGKYKFHRDEIRLARCFESTFIVSVGRVFSLGKNKKSPLRNTELFSLELSESERRLRDKILLYRDKLFAHSDSGYVKVDIHINEDVGNGVGVAIPQYFRGIYLSDDEQDRAMKLLNKYKNAIVDTLIKTAQVQMSDFESLKKELIDPEDLKLLHQLETE